MSESLQDYSLRKQVKKEQSGTIQKVGLVGCGTVGQEIARMVSEHGIEVNFIDISNEMIDSIMVSMGETIDAIINKWGMTHSDKRAILSRIKGSTDYKNIADSDFVIESINTRQRGTSLEARRNVFRKIEEVVRPEVLITSNNATLLISDLAAVLKHPERAVGFNFIQPASTVRIVEVIRGIDTSDMAYDSAVRFIKMMNKRPVTLNESLGNVSTRLIVTLINEACEILMEGVASVPQIDLTMKLGYGLQHGPFEMADRVGLDKVQKWMDNLYYEYGLQKFKASPILKRLVRANYLGRKVCKGFYKYEDGMIISHAISATEFK
jgi:3-hydroxybutyryl-CoA dehydrogenase